MTKKEKLEAQLNALKEKRKEYEIKADNCDVLQHSLKIFLNSAYGAFGSAFYPLYDIDIAESTTIGGKTATQEMVRYVNGYMNKLQGTSNEEFVIAGDTDSAAGNSIISTKNETIEDLFNKYHKLGLTQYLYPSGTEIVNIENYCIQNKLENDLYTYSINGKTKVKNISRHKVSKERWKIKIDDNELYITGDHSIMVYRDGQVIECKARDIKQTDCLLKRK